MRQPELQHQEAQKQERGSRFFGVRQWSSRNKSLIAIIGVIALGIFIPFVARADVWGSVKEGIIIVLGYITEFVVELLGKLLIAVIDILVYVAQYNDFGTAAAVNIGWVVVRDLANMLFIVALIIISFGTVIGWEQYRYNRLLGKLVITAVLVNFSKSITLFFIDFSQVVMMTFVNSFKTVAAGNLTTGFGIRALLSFAESSTSVDINLTGTVMIYALAIVLILVALIVTLTLIVVLVRRIISLWILIILSPLAWIASVMPGGVGKYNSEFWSRLGKEMFTGPALAFFLWLSFSVIFITSGGGARPTASIVNISSEGQAIVEETNVQAVQSEIGSSKNLFNYIVTVALLIHSMTIAETAGGFASKFAGKMSANIDRAGSAMVRGAGNLVKGAAKASTVGVARKGMETSAGRALLERMQNNLPAQLGGNWAARRMAAADQRQRQRVEKAGEGMNIKNMTNEQLQTSMRKGGIGSKQAARRNAMMEELMTRGKVDMMNTKDLSDYKKMNGISYSTYTDAQGRTQLQKNFRSRRAQEKWEAASKNNPHIEFAGETDPLVLQQLRDKSVERFRKMSPQKWGELDSDVFKDDSPVLDSLQKAYWGADQKKRNEIDKMLGETGREQLYKGLDPNTNAANRAEAIRMFKNMKTESWGDLKLSAFQDQNAVSALGEAYWAKSDADRQNIDTHLSPDLVAQMQEQRPPRLGVTPLADMSEQDRDAYAKEQKIRQKYGMDQEGVDTDKVIAYAKYQQEVESGKAPIEKPEFDDEIARVAEKAKGGKSWDEVVKNLDQFKKESTMSDSDYGDKRKIYQQLMDWEAENAQAEIPDIVGADKLGSRVEASIKRAQETGGPVVANLAVDFDKLGLKGAGGYVSGDQKEPVIDALAKMYNDQLMKDMETSRAQMNQQVTAADRQLIASQVQSFRKSLGDAEKIALANTKRAGYTLPHVLRHENAHAQIEAVEQENPEALEELFSTLAEDEQKRIVDEIANGMNIQALPDDEKRKVAIREYFTEGLANYGRTKDAVGSKLTDGMALALKGYGARLRSYQESTLKSSGAGDLTNAKMQFEQEKEKEDAIKKEMYKALDAMKEQFGIVQPLEVDELDQSLVQKELQENFNVPPEKIKEILDMNKQRREQGRKVTSARIQYQSAQKGKGAPVPQMPKDLEEAIDESMQGMEPEQQIDEAKRALDAINNPERRGEIMKQLGDQMKRNASELASEVDKVVSSYEDAIVRAEQKLVAKRLNSQIDRLRTEVASLEKQGVPSGDREKQITDKEGQIRKLEDQAREALAKAGKTRQAGEQPGGAKESESSDRQEAA